MELVRSVGGYILTHTCKLHWGPQFMMNAVPIEDVYIYKHYLRCLYSWQKAIWVVGRFQESPKALAATIVACSSILSGCAKSSVVSFNAVKPWPFYYNGDFVFVLEQRKERYLIDFKAKFDGEVAGRTANIISVCQVENSNEMKRFNLS